MKEEKMLKYMNLLDDKYILEASPSNAKGIRRNRRASKMLLRYGALAASLVICIGIGLIIPHLKTGSPAIPYDTNGQTDNFVHTGEIKLPETHTRPDNYNQDSVQDKIDNIQDAIGGGSTYFERRFVDETYNIAYLRAVYRDETGVVSQEELDKWVNNVYLKQESEERNEYPTIYQAIQYLGVTKEDFIALNNSRKERDSNMVLSEEIINALYLPEDEMKEALVHPCALYYDGEIYTWDNLRSVSVEVFVESEGVPGEVIQTYIDNLIVYCIEEEIIPESHISRYFGSEAEIEG